MFYEMRRASALCRAEAPNMEMMNFRDLWQRAEVIFHRGWVDSLRHRIERKIDRIAQQAPSAEKNNDDNCQTGDWIEQLPPSPEDR